MYMLTDHVISLSTLVVQMLSNKYALNLPLGILKAVGKSVHHFGSLKKSIEQCWALTVHYGIFPLTPGWCPACGAQSTKRSVLDGSRRTQSQVIFISDFPSYPGFPHQVTCENEVMTSRIRSPWFRTSQNPLLRMPDPLHPSGDLRKVGWVPSKDLDLKTGDWLRTSGLLFIFQRKRTTLQVLPVLRPIQFLHSQEIA